MLIRRHRHSILPPNSSFLSRMEGSSAKRLVWSALLSMAFSSIFIGLHDDDRYSFEPRLLLPSSEKTNHLRMVSLPIEKRFTPRVAFLTASGWGGTTSRNNTEPREVTPHSITSHIDSIYPITIRSQNSTTGSAIRVHDQTRWYAHGDSSDFRGMERRQWPEHPFQKKCVPMHKWQSTQFPSCNKIHEEMDWTHNLIHEQLSLLSSKGFWRHAWKYDEDGRNNTNSSAATNRTTTNSITVWKTFK